MTITADRVKETSSTTGTGPFALDGTNLGYRTFNSAFGVGPSFLYARAKAGSADWEVGIGHLSGASTLVRDTVLSSSNGGSLVSFTADGGDVFATAPAERLPLWADANGIAVVRPDGSSTGITTTVAANRDIAATDDGRVLECTNTGLTLRVVANLPAGFACAVIPKGTTSVSSDGTALINGATTTITRVDTSNPTFSIVSRASASDSYIITGS